MYHSLDTQTKMLLWFIRYKFLLLSNTLRLSPSSVFDNYIYKKKNSFFSGYNLQEMWIKDFLSYYKCYILTFQ